uniref:Uncharacterized protein n=1 Tax=Parascaris univalens TaxID=6257 RepID=A0A915AL54_PARUN
MLNYFINKFLNKQIMGGKFSIILETFSRNKKQNFFLGMLKLCEFVENFEFLNFLLEKFIYSGLLRSLFLKIHALVW